MTSGSESDGASGSRPSHLLAFAAAVSVGATAPLVRARGIDNYPEVAALVIGSSTAAVAGVASR